MFFLCFLSVISSLRTSNLPRWLIKSCFEFVQEYFACCQKLQNVHNFLSLCVVLMMIMGFKFVIIFYSSPTHWQSVFSIWIASNWLPRSNCTKPLRFAKWWHSSFTSTGRNELAEIHSSLKNAFTQPLLGFLK